MKRLALIIFLVFAGLVLLGATGLSILLASFSPHAYTQQISVAVEKSTGRQLQFQEDLALSFFPTPSLKTGRLVMHDPGIFGDDAFVTIEGASAVLSVKPLLQGIIHIDELTLYAPVLQLKTTAAGQNNWEYGFGHDPREDSAQESSAGTGDTAQRAGGSQSPSAGAPDRGNITPLNDHPEEANKPKSGFFSNLVIQVERFTCKDAQLQYRNFRTGESYTGVLDSVELNSVRKDADIPFSLAGRLTDDTQGRKLLFSLKGLARLDAAGKFATHIDALDMEAAGPAAKAVVMSNQMTLSYDLPSRRLEISDLKGKLDKAEYEGSFALALPKNTVPAQFTGELRVNNLNINTLMDKMAPTSASQDAKNVKGAPNLTKPRIGPAGIPPSGREASDNLTGNAGKTTAPPAGLSGRANDSARASAGANGTITVTIASLTLDKLLLDKLAFTLSLADNVVSIPFTMQLFDGATTGSARLDLRTTVPAVRLTASAKALNMEKLCRALSAKTIVSGALAADMDVNGQGGSWKEFVPTLRGKVSLLALKGEVKNFDLIPAHLRGAANFPVNFPFERLSGSGKIERGTVTSTDITLQSKLLSAAGGGNANLVVEQLDLGIDFMIAGNPPAIPVNITGPFTSPSSSVDMKAMMRNTAEGILETPENAKKLLKNAEKLFRN
jgi:AsmA protein